MSTNPKTPAEWQEAVNAAHVLLLVDSAIQYGLITGPKVDVARCEDILRSGSLLGVHPEPDAIEKSIQATNARTA